VIQNTPGHARISRVLADRWECNRRDVSSGIGAAPDATIGTSAFVDFHGGDRER
jgi:hypothetical protein